MKKEYLPDFGELFEPIKETFGRFDYIIEELGPRGPYNTIAFFKEIRKDVERMISLQAYGGEIYVAHGYRTYKKCNAIIAPTSKFSREPLRDDAEFLRMLEQGIRTLEKEFEKDKRKPATP